MNPDTDHPSYIARFIDALVLGEIADRLFEVECMRRGLSPSHCLNAPSLWLSGTMRIETTPQ